MIYDFYKNIVFTTWAEYSKFFADFWDWKYSYKHFLIFRLMLMEFLFSGVFGMMADGFKRELWSQLADTEAWYWHA